LALLGGKDGDADLIDPYCRPGTSRIQWYEGFLGMVEGEGASVDYGDADIVAG
jgi:hypothetical protein